MIPSSCAHLAEILGFIYSHQGGTSGTVYPATWLHIESVAAVAKHIRRPWVSKFLKTELEMVKMMGGMS